MNPGLFKRATRRDRRCHFTRPVLALLLGWAACLPASATEAGTAGGAPPPVVADLAADYLRAWRAFYPSQALAQGDASAAARFEDFAAERTDAWITRNRRLLKALGEDRAGWSLDDRIDARLLRLQARQELELWVDDAAPRRSPGLYARHIAGAFTHLLVRDNIAPEQKATAISARLAGIRRLCAVAREQLADGRPADTAGAIRTLEATASFLTGGFTDAAKPCFTDTRQSDFNRSVADAAAAIRGLAGHLRTRLQPRLTLPDAYGRDTYVRKMRLDLDHDLTPEELLRLAEAEIRTVRNEMSVVAERHWRSRYPAETVPVDFDPLVRRVLDDMEADRAADQQAFLRQFLELIDRAESFVRERGLATLPARRTLLTALSPAHFAGAAVGGVYSAGPFDPEAATLFYLPTIPDDAPAAARDGFYRSFNTAFNTMIITHEICPGHYLQLKLAAQGAHPVRALFGSTVFVEGWASFCEEMTLDAGWDGDRPLTRLAHLRKRLENAVRAYVSVQVHCHGWDRERLTRFAVDTGLLPPQFAENLWGRVLESPLQLPSYFLGYRGFSELYRAERRRLGDRFSLRAFNDAVLRSGGVPLDLLPEVLAEKP
ncbi:MAG TPA: DUF885 domain-containing protein [Acidobacteriota bacterium]|nr:DUF885 domain-containing protein [Acidobacteriota bacterium]HQF88096.1 DUF885 domain-containing protein [Acidobacteriota bacterium]HQG92094.1 DUF885 domain-containing protein [Acidobacteriota bacterium]